MVNGTLPMNKRRPVHYRTIFISDVHLGFNGCSARYLLDFLRSTTCDYLFLVGDIIDVWNMKKKLYWPQAHNDVLRTILGKAKHGTRVIYIPGNHDEMFRDYAGMELGNVNIHLDYVHTTSQGQKFYITHGDQFDAVVKFSRLLAQVGSSLYEVLLQANRYVNFFRRKIGFPYWSLANFLKQKVKTVMYYISSFERALAYEAKKKGADGLVAGHIHRPEITNLEGVIYCNCGDWVESCTALVEKQDGTLELIHWTEEQSLIKQFDLMAA